MKKHNENRTSHEKMATASETVTTAQPAEPRAHDRQAHPVGTGDGDAQALVSSEELVSRPLSAEQIEDLKTRAAKADEYWDRLLRQTADFDNYRKRVARERQEAVKYANATLIEKLVPIIDNFEMALSAADKLQSNAVDSMRQGLGLIHNQLKALLTEAGVEEIETLNKPFDPNWQEAVSEQETTEAPEGQVLQQLRKGYKLRERLIRPATVVVAKKPAA